MTNADIIRSMTDEELAKYMADIREFRGCPNDSLIDCQDTCAGCWLEWLRSEAND